MARAILIVQSDAAEGRDAAFNAWYDEVHLPDVLSVPGFVAAQRFVGVPSVHGELPDRRYLALYEIEADDIDAALKALSETAPNMEISSTLDRSSATTFAFRAIGERVEA